MICKGLVAGVFKNNHSKIGVPTWLYMVSRIVVVGVRGFPEWKIKRAIDYKRSLNSITMASCNINARIVWWQGTGGWQRLKLGGLNNDPE